MRRRPGSSRCRSPELLVATANSKGGLRAAFFVRACEIPTGTDNILVNGSNGDGFARKSRVRPSDFGVACCALAAMKAPRQIAGVELRTPAASVKPAGGSHLIGADMDRLKLSLKLALLVAPLVLSTGSAMGRDDGRFTDSPLKPWFDSLRSHLGPCCSDADGVAVADPDWDSHNGHYRVRLDGEWVDVPDDAVITEPNRAGRTMVWKHYIDGHPRVRCFLPGSMI